MFHNIRSNTRYVDSLLYPYHIWLYLTVIKLIGDVEENHGLKCSSCHSFSLFHWNVNVIWVHNLIKLSLLLCHIANNQRDLSCLSETFLDSSILSDDVNFDIPGYNPVIAEHPANS